MDAGGPFHTTRWSLVLSAGGADALRRRTALEELCSSYWYPLYAYLRRRGESSDDAADLVQGLFRRLLEDDALARVAPEGGRFRGWLLGVLKHHVADERRRAAADKRGGLHVHVAIDTAEGERRIELASPGGEAPEVVFERAWASQVLRLAYDALECSSIVEGQRALFDALAPELLDPDAARPRAEVAAQLGMEPVALRVAVHRLKRRYREEVLRVVRETLGPDLDAGEELRALHGALAGEIRTGG